MALNCIRAITISLAPLLLLLFGNFSGALATQTPIDPENQGSQLEPPTTKIWEFGMSISSKSRSSGITATVPIPNNWPEQVVEVVSEHPSDNVARISYKKLPNNARQMLFRVNRLNPGETAQATVRIRITKNHLSRPADPAKLKLFKKIPSKFKQFLRPSPFIESNDERIKALAAELQQAEGTDDFQHVENIYKWVRKNVEYEFDTKIRTCVESLDAKKGDCEELSSLFIAICRAQGIPARAVWIPSHTYPEFLMADEKGEPNWIPCQIAGSYDFGAMPEDRPILQKGDRFTVPGEPKPVRYVKPTLVARDSAGGLGIQWIMQEITGESSESSKQVPLREESPKHGLFNPKKTTQDTSTIK